MRAMRACPTYGEPLPDQLLETDTCDACEALYDEYGVYFVPR